MDERATDPAITVHEWVNRLELRVRKSGLGHRGQRVSIAEDAQILKQLRDVFRRRRDERGGTTG